MTHFKYPECTHDKQHDCLAGFISLGREFCKCLTDTNFENRDMCPFYKSNKEFKKGGEPIERQEEVL